MNPLKLSSCMPTPVPPWATSKSVPHELRRIIRDLLLDIHLNEEGRAVLARGRLARCFSAAVDGDYDAHTQNG